MTVEEDNALTEWRYFEKLHLEEGRVTELQLYHRYSVSVEDGKPTEQVRSADQTVLRRFYSYEQTPEFKEQLAEILP